MEEARAGLRGMFLTTRRCAPCASQGYFCRQPCPLRRATSSNFRGVPSGFVASKVNIKIVGHAARRASHHVDFTNARACGLAPWCESSAGKTFCCRRRRVLHSHEPGALKFPPLVHIVHANHISNRPRRQKNRMTNLPRSMNCPQPKYWRLQSRLRRPKMQRPLVLGARRELPVSLIGWASI